MEDNVKYQGYHATIEENASNILSNGFKVPSDNVNKVSRYWLGSGVYFFEDIEVAKWWCTKPTKTFGDEGKHVILKSEICPKKVFDLRKASSWRNAVIFFDEFMKLTEKTAVVELPDDIRREHIRCLFFNWLKKALEADMIIAAFNQDEFKYLNKGTYRIEKEMDIYYTEVQYCVYDTKIISSTVKI